MFIKLHAVDFINQFGVLNFTYYNIDTNLFIANKNNIQLDYIKKKKKIELLKQAFIPMFFQQLGSPLTIADITSNIQSFKNIICQYVKAMLWVIYSIQSYLSHCRLVKQNCGLRVKPKFFFSTPLTNMFEQQTLITAFSTSIWNQCYKTHNSIHQSW